MNEQSSQPKKKPDQPVLMPHNYDGIQEFDQRLPNWWLWSLYLAIIFSFGYWLINYSLGYGRSNEERLAADMIPVTTMRETEIKHMMAVLDDEHLWQMSRESAVIERGKVVFETICVACHAKDLSAKLNGAALPGLPLNDNEWKNGGKPMEIFKTVSKGAPDVSKGMIAWEPALGTTKVAEVVAYVLSHHKKNSRGVATPDGGPDIVTPPTAATTPPAGTPPTPAPAPSPVPAPK